MSIEVSDLLHLAQQLSAGNSECEWRSGASRAYYAAYHKTLAVADACLPSTREVAGQHERLTNRLMTVGNKGRALAYVLIDLKKVRTHADYHLTKPFSQHDATDLVANCLAFLPKTDAFQGQINSTLSTTF
ncbi:hypothetical protein [Caballeronia sp. GAWG2-1]|jgi:uncharacterized protein (UPF0332 family)|uniref:hypothetical protein n=1 Tax=Caballeronia sp. GAWG2-1 TaxID=2921744 RepID=UPI002028CB7C|nr:hypothetical protein [Caballeronia sp. GAWG2-1]